MKRSITITLDPKSIDSAIREVRKSKRKAEFYAAQALIQRLVDFGVEIVKVKIANLGAVSSGSLLSGVDGYFSPMENLGFVKVSSDHAAFVEFGTGVVGQNSPHKNGEYLARAAWDYASGSKIFTTKDGKVGWIYPTKDGKFRFTEGMESRPFMYQTALELQSKFPEIVKEVFALDQ